jgi:hypothetical protein
MLHALSRLRVVWQSKASNPRKKKPVTGVTGLKKKTLVALLQEREAAQLHFTGRLHVHQVA